MSQTAALYHLQTIDSQIDGLQKRLDEIDVALTRSEAIQKATSAAKQAHETLSGWQSKQSQLEHERDHLQAEAQAADQRLYSGQIFNPREMTDLQDKLAELKTRLADLETPLLEAFMAAEENENTLKQSQSHLEQVTAEHAAANVQLATEREDILARLAALSGEQAQARSAVDAPHLSTYDRLRQRPGKSAVVVLHGSECRGCGVGVTAQVASHVRRGDVLTCATCGRILHAA